MRTYQDFKIAQQNFFNESTNDYLGFAFGNEQFEEMCIKLNVKDPSKELLSIGYGGYILKSRKEDYIKVLSEMDNREKKFKKENSVEAIKDSIIYELNNHEWEINEDALEEALESLGYPTDIKKLDKKTRKALNLAVKELTERNEQ